MNLRLFFLYTFGCLGLTAAAPAAPVSIALAPSPSIGKVVFSAESQVFTAWKCDEKPGALIFKSPGPIAIPENGFLYLKVAYVDSGYGKISVHLTTGDGKQIQPDRFLGLSRSDSKRVVSARMRLPGVQSKPNGEISVRIALEHPKPDALYVESVTLQNTPFDDPQFAYVISDPWDGPYTGPRIKAKNNTTLKGKVMVGYQGWFRTPNDPSARGWVHWGNMQEGAFTTDMWPDITQYPPHCLEKTANVKLKSGRNGYLFSSAWPEVVNTHFRWMRENEIDGAFLQRFVSDQFRSGPVPAPEWVLANVRAAANREGRIWAVEYDVSGYSDAKLLETLKIDWKWFVEKFRVLDDPNYAREGGKPVVFIWGMPFPDRRFTPETANAVVDFFKNDPKYGGNYVIGGIHADWRKADEAWQTHFKKYDCVSPWMSQAYEQDIADFKKLGLDYYAHVKPGFSWANLMHLPSGDETIAYTPRDGGRYYWSLLSKAAQARVDRLFVGMFDEYDESTAIMPMSDDAPPTPVRPGVFASFSNPLNRGERPQHRLLPNIEFPFGSAPPAKQIPAENFGIRMSGQIVFPAAGQYTFSIEGAADDRTELFVNGKKIVAVAKISGPGRATTPVSAIAGQALPYRLDYHHGTGAGTLRLLWESNSIPRQPVPATALRDAWGRFITTDGKPTDWWLQLTKMGKEMMLGKRKTDLQMP